MASADRDPCEILEWDTDFFGFPIGRVRGAQLTKEQVWRIDAWCREGGLGCLYLLCSPNDRDTVRLAEDNNFRFVDVRLTFEREISSGTAALQRIVRPYSRATIRQFRAEDIDRLREIAGSSHYGTRFYFDGNFPTELCQALYEKWIERSCRGYADAVLVAVSEDDIPIAYLSCHLEEGASHGKIGLLGVSEQVQGRGIGRQLVFEAADWFAVQGAGTVRVVTQARNVIAQRLYQTSGFLTTDVQLWYHKWYEIPVSASAISCGKRDGCYE